MTPFLDAAVAIAIEDMAGHLSPTSLCAILLARVEDGDRADEIAGAMAAACRRGLWSVEWADPATMLAGLVSLGRLKGSHRGILHTLASTVHDSTRGKTRTWIAIGGPAHAADARRAAEEAASALQVLELRSSEPAFAIYEDVIPAAMLLTNETGRRRLARLLSPLEEFGRRAELLLTLETLAEESFELTRTAARLGIHRHTVRYRVRLIERLLGRSLTDLPDQTLISLALEARRLEQRISIDVR